MTIHVANFDTDWKDEDLNRLFSPYGQVSSAVVMMDLFTNHSRGFGYVDMPDEKEGATAVESLHQTEVNKRKLDVKVAEPQKAPGGSYKVGNGGVNPYRFKKN